MVCYHESMDDIQKVRYINLLKILDAIETDLEFCERTGIDGEHLNQLKMSTPADLGGDFGEKLARKLELSIGLAKLYIDQDNFEVGALTKSKTEIDERTKRMLDTFMQLSEENQQTLMVTGLAFLKSSESNLD